MNKTWTAAMVAALFPLTLSAYAADTAQLHTDKKMTVPVTAKQVVPVDLEEASKAEDVTLPQQPVHMTADRFLTRNSDGYVKSQGNVDIKQGMDEVHAHYVEGNMNSGVYHTKGPVVYVNDENAIVGKDVTYDSKNGGMSMDKFEGFIAPDTYARGTGAEMYENSIYLQHGLLTTPHAVAKTPDYYITGDDIHIYPGEKYTAENTALWFKHIRLFTYGHYEGRLDSTSKHNPYLLTLLPRPTYTKRDGIGFRGYADVPLNENGDLFFHFRYHATTRNGFRPEAKIQKNTKLGSFRFGYSQEESTDNDDHIWATKWPELEYFAPRINFGHSGIYVDSKAEWGRWSEDNRKTGAHEGFRTEITHVPIRLWTRANVRFFAGYRKDWYEAYNVQRRDPYTGVVFNQGINDRLWTSLWYKKHNLSGYSPYRFDTLDHPHQKGFSIGYVLTPLDTVIFTLAKDLNSDDISDRNITWIRDLHSFVASVTYKQVKKEWEFTIQAKDLDF